MIDRLFHHRPWPPPGGQVYLELLPGRDFALRTNPRLFLGEHPLRLGRGPDNDLVLSEPSVSAQHATVGVARCEVYVRDLGSTHGTWVDDVQVDGEAALRPGQVLRLGETPGLLLGSSSPQLKFPPAWRLEVLGTGAGIAIPPSGLRVGQGPAVDLAIPLEGLEAFTVTPGEESADLRHDGQVEQVRPGVPFMLGGVHFRICPCDSLLLPQVIPGCPTDSYRLHVALGGPAGAEARVEDLEQHRVCHVTAENRAVLLYVLGARTLEDRAAHRRADLQGWCTNDEVASGIWGREADRLHANNLNVLLHRLRHDLNDAGFDARFLEKRKGALRARLGHVSLDNGARC